MKVLSFGSLNIDYVYNVPHLIVKGETLAAASLSIYTGGKGLNQSIAPAKAALDVCRAGAAGQEGLFLLDELKAAGGSTEHVRILPGVKSGHTIIQRNTDGGNCILLYGGVGRQIAEARVDDTLAYFLQPFADGGRNYPCVQVRGLPSAQRGRGRAVSRC